VLAFGLIDAHGLWHRTLTFWTLVTVMANSSFFFFMHGKLQNIYLCMPLSHIRSYCSRKDLCTVYMFFAVYFDCNINIFYFVHFSTAAVETSCNQVRMGHGKKE
jgi:hypothetical protein